MRRLTKVYFSDYIPQSYRYFQNQLGPHLSEKRFFEIIEVDIKNLFLRIFNLTSEVLGQERQPC
jgi:hypothetical protein